MVLRTSRRVAERDQTTGDAFSKALELLGQLRNVAPIETESGRELILWKSAAETEYLAFRIATIHGLGDYDPESTNEGEFSVDHARDLIAKAQESLDSDPRKAYREVRQAIDILRKLPRVGRKSFSPTSSPPKNG